MPGKARYGGDRQERASLRRGSARAGIALAPARFALLEALCTPRKSKILGPHTPWSSSESFRS